jgi:hypothetical protein
MPVTSEAEAMKAKLHAMGYSEEDIREMTGFTGDTIWDDSVALEPAERDVVEQAKLTVQDMQDNWEAFERVGLLRMIEDFENLTGGGTQ